MDSVAATRSGLKRFVPALSWVPDYQLSWLSKDAIAGFTIWGLPGQGKRVDMTAAPKDALDEFDPDFNIVTP